MNRCAVTEVRNIWRGVKCTICNRNRRLYQKMLTESCILKAGPVRQSCWSDQFWKSDAEQELLEEQAPGVKSDSALILEPFTDGLLIDIQRLLFNFWNLEDWWIFNISPPVYQPDCNSDLQKVIYIVGCVKERKVKKRRERTGVSGECWV